MEIIYLIVLFIVPGLLIKMLSDYFSILDKYEQARNTIYENMFFIVVDSIFINTLTIIAYNNIVTGDKIANIDILLMKFHNFQFCGRYIIIGLIATVIYVLIKRVLVFAIHKLKNSYLKHKYGLIYQNNHESAVWQNIMHYDATGNDEKIVSIYHYGEYVVSGILWGYNSKKNEGKEFRLIRTDEIERVINSDKTKDPSERLLNYVDKVYYDSETGLMIKFYNKDVILKHWDEI